MAISILDTAAQQVYNTPLSETGLNTTGANFLVVVVSKFRGTTGAQNWDLTGDVGTWNGDNLTMFDYLLNPSTNRYREVSIHYLANPDEGEYTLSWPQSLACYVAVCAYALSGVDTSDPFGDLVKETSDGDYENYVAVTTEADGSLIVLGCREGGNTYGPNLSENNITEDFYHRNATNYQSSVGLGHKVCTTANTYSDLGWSSDQTTYHTIIAAEVKESSGGGAVRTQRLLERGLRIGMERGT